MEFFPKGIHNRCQNAVKSLVNIHLIYLNIDTEYIKVNEVNKYHVGTVNVSHLLLEANLGKFLSSRR